MDKAADFLGRCLQGRDTWLNGPCVERREEVKAQPFVSLTLLGWKGCFSTIFIPQVKRGRKEEEDVAHVRARKVLLDVIDR